MKDKKSQVRTVQAVDRAFAIIDALASHPEGITLSGLAESLSLAPQTVQSLVRTLQVHGLAAQPEKGTPYFLGPTVHQLSRRWLRGDGTSVIARGVVTRLSREIQEYVLLAELRGMTLLPLCEVRSDQALAVSHSWDSDHWYQMGTGQLILAFLPEDEQKQIIDKFTASGTIDPEPYIKTLQQIRRDGHIVCQPKRSPGISALAVPVRNVTGEINLSLGTAVPTVRLTADYEAEILAKLKVAAEELEGLWA